MHASKDPRSAAEALFLGEGLELPPVPASLDGAWRQIDAAAFATRELAWTLYDFARFRDELLAADAVAPYVAFGFAGHGLLSQAVHYYAVTGRCAVLLQLRWGNALGDPEQARRAWRGSMQFCRRFDAAVEAASLAETFPRGRRIVAAHSDFSASRWTWLEADHAPQWHESRGLALPSALAAVHALGGGPARRASAP